MSFVGPRPLRPGEVDTTAEHFVPLDAIPGYVERHQVRPGLTGLAQVHAPRDVPRDEKFRYDLEYVRTANSWLDLKLIAAVVLDLVSRPLGTPGAENLTRMRRI